jgi:hypothetical protein
VPALNRNPAGFLSLLQAKSLGEDPDNYLQDVRPVIELLPFLLNRVVLEDLFANQSSATIGTRATITIPQGELWIPKLVSSQALVDGAPSDIQFAPCLITPSAGPICLRPFVRASGLSAAADFFINAQQITDTLVLGGGWGFGTEVGENVVGVANTAFTTRVAFYRLLV